MEDFTALILRRRARTSRTGRAVAKLTAHFFRQHHPPFAPIYLSNECVMWCK